MSDMSENNFTLDELETLAQAYLECRLSLLQEKELELVLMSETISSPIIDEARETMFAMEIAAHPAKVCAPARRSRLRKILIWGSMAACVAALVVAAMMFPKAAPAEADTYAEAKVVVYVDGRKVTGREARTLVARKQAADMALFNQTMTAAFRESNNNIRMVNTLINKQ